MEWNYFYDFKMGLSLYLQCMSFCSIWTAYLILCFYVSTICVCLWSLCFISASPLCSKPQKVKTFVVEKPALMRAVVSQTSPTSNQPDKEHFSQLQPREDHLIKNQDCSLFSLQEPNRKPLRNDQPFWSQSQNFFTEEISTKDHLSINTLHLFPERQYRADQPAMLCPKLEKASHEGFTLSVAADIKPSQGDPDRSCQLQASPAKHDCSPKQKKTQYTQHRETSDVRNTEHNHVKR